MDYTYKDMLAMQEDAARRVREMKKRAVSIVSDENESIAAQTGNITLPDKVKRISYPVEINEAAEDNTETEQKQNVNDVKNKSSAPDSDIFLILAILVLISQNTSSFSTILALMYILL